MRRTERRAAGGRRLNMEHGSPWLITSLVFLGAALALVLVCLAIYPIGKALGLRIQAELTERRRAYAATEA